LKAVNGNVKCMYACDGAEALTMLRELTDLPDYVFLDSNMPIMDGKKCLKGIKAQTRLKEIPVVIYTTSSNTDEIAFYKSLGAHDFIVKPGSFSMLVDILKSYVDRANHPKTGNG
jgi:CheY-like chemotaxis protein